MLIDVTDATFEAEVTKSAVPVLIDMWAPWCGPCRMIEPIVSELAEKYAGKANICKMNIDENPQTPSSLQILGIPTILFFKAGNVVDKVVGAQQKATLEATIEKHLFP